MQGAALTQWRLGKWFGPGILRGLARLRPFGLLRRVRGRRRLGGLRRLGGVVLTLGVVASVAMVGQAAGWLADPPPTQLATQAADGEARLLSLALRQLPPDGLPEEARFAETSTAVPSELVSVHVRPPGDAVLTVRLVGQASSGAFDGRSDATVVRCYAMDWQPPQLGGSVGNPVPTACPALPAVPAGAPSGSELAAELNAGTTGERTGRPGVFATGQPGACAYAETRPSGRLLAWAAPLLAPCTTAAAREAVAFGA